MRVPSFFTAAGAFPVAFLLAYGGLLFFPGLGERDLTSSHEARAAQNGQMILSDGCWGLPRLFDQHLELQKPPLYYWLVALFGRLLGGAVDAWAVRLPAAFSALACILFVYYLGHKSGRARAGFLAALVLATSLHFTWLARVGRIDMPLTLMITLAAGSCYLAITGGMAHRRAWPWYLLGYVSVALGILLKGPIALVLAGVIVGAFALTEWRRQRRENACEFSSGLFRSLWWGVPLLILIAAPWFIWANIETNNQVWEVFFWYHNLERGLGGSETLAAHPLWFYLPRVLVDLFPWSLALPAAAWYFCRRVGWSQDREARFGALWFLGVLGLLSCMSFKRADYLLPAYPGIALFLGCMADRYWQRLGSLLAPHAHGKLLRAPLSPYTRGERAGVRGDSSSRENYMFLQTSCAPSPLPLSPEYGGEGGKHSRLNNRRLGISLGVFLTFYAVGWGVYNLYFVPSHEQGKPYYQLARDIRAHTDKPVIFFRAESHVLAFHVGRPLDTILEWENLDIWVSRPFPVYFVMPPDCARDWPGHLTHGRLEEVLRTSDHPWGKRERPLVVMRSYPHSID